MYFVIVSSIIGNSIVESYEYKEEAKERCVWQKKSR